MRFGDSLFVMSALWIGVVALFFLGMGFFGLIAPTALIRPFGIEPTAPEARGEVRAVYGGFGVVHFTTSSPEQGDALTRQRGRRHPLAAHPPGQGGRIPVVRVRAYAPQTGFGGSRVAVSRS
ncbi:DUF4345 family protein [Streptomyces sp. NPDC050164]|uniref:DUF4345 family protein n=1 Tax=Streptomyces sp. NPDC050164 TaxID=3365605 RepID=UPI00378ED53C